MWLNLNNFALDYDIHFICIYFFVFLENGLSTDGLFGRGIPQRHSFFECFFLCQRRIKEFLAKKKVSL